MPLPLVTVSAPAEPTDPDRSGRSVGGSGGIFERPGLRPLAPYGTRWAPIPYGAGRWATLLVSVVAFARFALSLAVAPACVNGVHVSAHPQREAKLRKPSRTFSFWAALSSSPKKDKRSSR